MAATKKPRPGGDRAGKGLRSSDPTSPSFVSQADQATSIQALPPVPLLSGEPGYDAERLTRWAQRVRQVVCEQESVSLNQVLADSQPPDRIPAWQERLNQLDTSALEQVALTEARAASAARADGFAEGLTLGHLNGYRIGLAEGLVWLASAYRANHEQFLDTHHRNLAKNLASGPQETFADRMERLGEHERAERARQIARRWEA